jgi:hypothetical protein
MVAVDGLDPAIEMAGMSSDLILKDGLWDTLESNGSRLSMELHKVIFLPVQTGGLSFEDVISEEDRKKVFLAGTRGVGSPLPDRG